MNNSPGIYIYILLYYIPGIYRTSRGHLFFFSSGANRPSCKWSCCQDVAADESFAACGKYRQPFFTFSIWMYVISWELHTPEVELLVPPLLFFGAKLHGFSVGSPLQQ